MSLDFQWHVKNLVDTDKVKIRGQIPNVPVWPQAMDVDVKQTK